MVLTVPVHELALVEEEKCDDFSRWEYERCHIGRKDSARKKAAETIFTIRFTNISGEINNKLK